MIRAAAMVPLVLLAVLLLAIAAGAAEVACPLQAAPERHCTLQGWWLCQDRDGE